MERIPDIPEPARVAVRSDPDVVTPTDLSVVDQVDGGVAVVVAVMVVTLPTVDKLIPVPAAKRVDALLRRATGPRPRLVRASEALDKVERLSAFFANTVSAKTAADPSPKLVRARFRTPRR